MVFPTFQANPPATLDQFFGVAGARAERGLFAQDLGSAFSGSLSADAPASTAAGIISPPKQAVSQTAESRGQKKDRLEKDQAQNVGATALATIPLESSPCVPLPIPVDSPQKFVPSPADGPAKTGISSERTVSPENTCTRGADCAVPAKETNGGRVEGTKQLQIEQATSRVDSPGPTTEHDQHPAGERPFAGPSGGSKQSPTGAAVAPGTRAAIPPLVDQSNGPNAALVAPSPGAGADALQQKWLKALSSANVPVPGLQMPQIEAPQISDVVNAPHPPVGVTLTETPPLTLPSLPRAVTAAQQAAREISSPDLTPVPAPGSHIWDEEVCAAKSESVPSTSETPAVVSKFMNVQLQKPAISSHEMRADAPHAGSAAQNTSPAPSDSHQAAAQSTQTQERKAEPVSDQSKPNPPTSVPAAVMQPAAPTASDSSVGGLHSPPASTPTSPSEPSPGLSRSGDVTPTPPLHDVPQPTPAAPLPVQVHAARMVQNEDRAEMKLDMRTEIFGAVEVRTTVSGKDVQLAVSAEHGDLRAFLASEMPALQNSLQQHDMRLEHIRTLSNAGTQPEFSSGSGKQEQRFSRPRPRGGTLFQDEPGTGDFSNQDFRHGLSIRV